MKKSMYLFVVPFLVAYSAIASWSDEVTDPTNQSVLEVAIDKDYAPYEFVDINGEVSGFTPDLLTEIGLNMGLSFHFVPMNWPDAVAALEKGDIHLINMIRTPDRLKHFEFSMRHSQIKQAIFRQIGTHNITNLDSLKGHRVAFQQNDISQEVLADRSDFTKVEVQDKTEGFLLLNSGYVDAFLAADQAGLRLIQEYHLDKVEPAFVGLFPQDFCFVSKLGNKQLIERLNRGLEALKSSGRYDQIVDHWLAIRLEEHGWFVHYWRVFAGLIIFLSALVVGIMLWNVMLRRAVSRQVRALRLSEDSLKKAQQMARLGSWEFDIVSNVLIWSEGTYEIFGVDAEKFEVSFDSFLNLIHPEDRERVQNSIQHAIKEKIPAWTIDYRILLPSSEVRYVHEEGKSVLSDQKTMIGRIGTVQDLTELKLTELMLKESEARYLDYYENAPDMYLSVDAKTAFVKDCNLALVKTIGRPKEQIIGRPVFEIYHPRCHQQAREFFKEFLECGVLHDKELLLKCDDGSERVVSLNVTAIQDGNGKILCSRSTLRDITNRKQLEEELVSRERAYSTLVDSLPDYIVRYDSELKRTYVNPAWQKASGLSLSDVIGVLPHDIPKVPRPVVQGYLESLQKVLANGEEITTEFSWTNTKGEELFLEYNILPEHDNAGNISGVLAIGRDISERKRGELERLAHLKFLENLDRVNRSIQGTNDLEQMLGDLLEVVLSVFDCDRSFLLFPCDPESPTWSIPVERNKPEFPGVRSLNAEIPMDSQVRETLRTLLDSDEPVIFRPGTDHALPVEISKQFQIKSFMAMAIHPKIGKAWQFGIHQCTHDRKWTNEETRLFQEIGRRLSDRLTVLLSYRDLCENEKFLETIVEHIPNMIFVKDAKDLKFIRVNKAGESLLGYPRDEFINKTDYDFFPHDVADFFTANDRKALESKAVIDIQEEMIQTRAQGERILHTKKIPIMDEKGNPQFLLGISEDITNKKEAEDQLQRSAQRLRLHSEFSPLGFLEWDKHFCVMEWNAACERIFGYTREEALGRHAKDLILPVEVHDLVDGIYQSLMIQTGGKHSVNKNVTKDGRTIICEWFNTTLIGKDGEAIGVASVCNDITEQTLRDDSIRQLSQAIEQSPVSILVTDNQGNISFVNATFSKVTGYSAAEVVGKNPRIWKSGETSHEEYKQLWDTILDGKVWKGEFHNRKKDGGLFWEHATIAPVKNADGAITNFVAVKEDITERKMLEDQLRQTQKMEAVGQLAGGVAHDFNNMLGVIMGYTEMVLEKVNDDSLREDMEQIRMASHRSADITRQLLAFARKQTIIPRVLNLNKTVENMLKLLRRLIGEDVDLRWHPGKDLWSIHMDPTQIDQILANLCVNAKDAIAGVGKISIETENIKLDESYCSMHRGFQTGDYVMMAVSDNGCGMDNQTLNKIFEPFFTTKGLGKGTGLGLATVYGIVKQNAGFINVYSEPGHGTTFKIYFARHILPSDKVEEELPVSKETSGAETILVVEDETSVLGMVKVMLERCGYTVLTAPSPGDAIQTATDYKNEIHLILTDMVMPEMSGRDLVVKLKELRPDLKCLFMSGYTGNVITDLDGNFENGMKFIQKPFTKQKLASEIRALFDEES